MTTNEPNGQGTKENPWNLKTPSGTSEYSMYKDEMADPPVLVCVVGKTVLHYYLRSIEDLHTMLKEYGDWMPSARSLWHVHAAAVRGAWPGRGGTQPQEQPYASNLTVEIIKRGTKICQSISL